MSHIEEAIARFYRNLLNGVESLLKEELVTKKTTVEGLIEACNKKVKENVSETES